MPPRVVHHTLLAHRGGAARVAAMLHRQLVKMGRESLRTAEVLDVPGDCVRTMPSGVARHAPGGLVHLHATADWEATLGGLVSQLRIVVTLHDASLLTGGCAYPLDCTGWSTGCATPCPRGYADAAQRQARRRALLYDLSPQLVSPSGWLARMARQVLPGLPCTVIPNGVPIPAPIATGMARREFGIVPGAFVVLCMAHGGEASQMKGGSHWAALWRDIKAAVPHALGIFVGGESMAREGDLLRLPYLEQERLDVLRAAADVFLHPALADNHPLGVLEALAAGVPVCAFAVGGVPEIVRDGVTGRLVTAGDYGALAAACIELARMPRLGRDYGCSGRDLAVRCFDEARMARDYVRLYDEMTDGRE